MSLDVVYRIIEVSDVFNVMSLIQELGYEVDEKTMIDNILKFNKTDLKQCSWVAEQNGKLIGCIAVSIMDNFHLPNSFLKIHSLIVSENSRKLGIGKHLMMMAEFFAKKNKCSQRKVLLLYNGFNKIE